MVYSAAISSNTHRIIRLYFFVLLLLLVATQLHAELRPEMEAGIVGGHENTNMRQTKMDVETPPANGLPLSNFPGRIVDMEADAAQIIFHKKWPYRNSTYEIIAGDKRRLAGMVCGLAYFCGDLPPAVPLEKCINGVQGFHYTAAEAADWATALHRGSFPHRNSFKEDQLIRWLIDDGALIRTQTGFRSSGKVKHIIGAAPGKKRKLYLNINHERLHVMWDEDRWFREYYIKLWRSDPSHKRLFLSKHKVYSSLPELRQIEEWAVRMNEDKEIGQHCILAGKSSPR